MKNFYEEKDMKWIRKAAVISLTLLSVLLFFKVYAYFENSVQVIIGTTFPFILSFIIVYTLMPFINILSEKFKMKRGVSITLVLCLFFLFFIYVILAVIPLLAEQLGSFIGFISRNQDTYQKNLLQFLETNNISIKSSIINSKEMIAGQVFKVIGSSISFLTGSFSLIFMTPVFTIMLIYSYDSIGKGIKKNLIEFNKEKWIPLISQIDDAIGRYIKVTVLDSIIVGTCSYIVFFFLKLEYSPLFAIMIGAWNAIPFIGPFIGLIPAVLYAATKSFKLVVLIIVLITIVQTIEANILKPWMTSKSVDIHPITTLLVVLVGGALFGMGGAFVAIPVYIVMKLTFIFCIKNRQEQQ